MKWEDEDKGYPTLSALNALNLNLDLNPAARPRTTGFVGDSLRKIREMLAESGSCGKNSYYSLPQNQ